jgi:hypothetical protein
MGDDGQLTGRVELDSGEHPLVGREVCYGFSLSVPLGFPILDNSFMIARWKRNGVARSPRFDGRNLIASMGRDWLLNYFERFLDRNRRPKLLL